MFLHLRGSLAYPHSAPAKHEICHTQDLLPIVSVMLLRHGLWHTQISCLSSQLPSMSRPGIWYTNDYIHIYQPSRWWCQDMVRRFRRTPTPMEECTYSELILLCTFELEHCCFALKMCDISTAPHTRSTNGKYFEHIEFNDPWICCAEFVLWYVVMNLCILICGDVFVGMFLWRLCICVYPLHNEPVDGPSHFVLWIWCFVRQPFKIGSLKIFTAASNATNIINIPEN